MAELYNAADHSLVQAFMKSDRTCQFEANDFLLALLSFIAGEIDRVYGNVKQEPWEELDLGDAMPGIYWRAYRYEDCDCEGGHESDCIQGTPHFQFEDVEFDWYKYPGRGTSTNKDWNETEWREWFDRCLAHVRSFDKDEEA